jgi:hypothetical protein
MRRLFIITATALTAAWTDCKSPVGFCANNLVEKAAERACAAICKQNEYAGRCQHCLEDHTACVVTVIKKVPMMTGDPDKGGGLYLRDGSKEPAMSTPGEKYPVTGGSSLKWLCQHGGLCISSDAVKFDEPCTYMPGQGWEKVK